MGKKSRTKKERRQAKQQLEKEPFYWEDLEKTKNGLIESLLTSQQTIGSLFQHYGAGVYTEGDTEDKKKITESVLGMMKSYQDFIPRIESVMKQHVEETVEKEDGTVEYKFKKGKVNTDGDDMFEFINIATQYNELNEVMADISSVGFIDLFTKIKNIDPNVTDEEINKLKEVNIKGKTDVLMQQLKFASAMPGGEQAIQEAVNVINKENE